MGNSFAFPALTARGASALYFNVHAAAHITSPRLAVKECGNLIIFEPSNISMDYKVIRKKTGGCEIIVSGLYEARVLCEGDVFKIFRTPSGALAIKKYEPIMRKEKNGGKGAPRL